MSHVVTRPHDPFSALDGALEVHQVPMWQDNLSWVLVDRSTRQAAVVDGPPDADTLLSYCESKGIRLTTVLNTHTHGDHIGINTALADKGLLADMRVIGPEKVASAVPGITEVVSEGSPVRLGDSVGTVMVTEGHLDGHVSFVFGDALFCGDTLFAGGCGYLFDGPPQTMYESLMRLAKLPDGTRVCCAHEYTQDNLRFAWTVEPDNEALADRIAKVWELRERGRSAVPSRIEEERATNPFLRTGSPTILSILARVMPEAELTDGADAFAALRRLKDSKRYRKLPDEKLPI